MHDVLTIGIPILAILAGVLFNRNDIRELRAEMRSEIGNVRSEIGSLRVDMNTRFDRVDADLRQFYSISGKLEGRVDEISKHQG